MMRRRSTTPIWVFFLVLSISPAFGQAFTPPIQLNGIGSYVQPRVSVGQGSDVAVLFEGVQDLHFTSSLGGFGQPQLVTTTPTASANGRFEFGALSAAEVVYDEDTNVPGHSGKDIYLVSNTGGSFGTSMNLTQTDGIDETFPCITILSSGSTDIAYQRQVGAGTTEIYISRNLGPSLLVGVGDQPRLTNLNLTTSFVAYHRGGALYGRTFDGAVVGAEEVIANDTPSNSGLEIDADAAGVVHCAYLDAGALTYRSRLAGGGYSAEEVRDPGPVAPPSLSASPGGRVGIAISRVGQIHLHQLDGGVWDSENLTPTLFNAEQPSVGLDEFGFAHVAYKSGNNIRYITNVPAPTPEFVASTTNALLPHTVTFTNLSSGHISTFFWDFGDGATSTQVSPTHTYTTPGTRTVSLTLTGPGGTATETKVGYITSVLPPNVLQLPVLPVIPGQSVKHPVLATHPDPIQGFQIAVQFDDALTPITDLDLGGTVTGALGPDFVYVLVTPNGATSNLVSAVLLETQEPFVGLLLSGGTDQPIASLVYDVPASLPVGSTADILLMDGLGTNNIFSPPQGASITPYFLQGGIDVQDPLTSVLFVRGNANNDPSDGIDIADAVFVLTFLFAMGAPPTCPDAADANDNGSLDIADAVFILTFLFGGTGQVPPYPFPDPGLDPTPDTLGPCMASP